MIFRKFLLIISLFLTLNCFGQEKDVSFNYGLEIFPLVIPFRIYSAQFVYGFSNKDYFVIWFTYLNNYYPNKKKLSDVFMRLPLRLDTEDIYAKI